MKPKILIIGATGRVGSQVVEQMSSNSGAVELRLSSQNPDVVEKWRAGGQEAELLDLNNPDTFGTALKGVDRVFLLTTYSSDMLQQSKQLVDAARDAKVSHIVHLGVFTSRNDRIRHFIWHDMIERYIESSGISWTHLHPNVIADTTLVTDPPMSETGSFTVLWGEALQGWVFAEDIAAVAAKVLQEGPDKHASAEYWMSTEVLSGPEVARILSDASGMDIQCQVLTPDVLVEQVKAITATPVRAYMESAVITMQLAQAGKMTAQAVVRDDVAKVLGRPGISMAEWARRNLRPTSAPAG